MKTIIGTLLLASRLCALAQAQVVNSASVDQGKLTITGIGLQNLAKSVTFDGQPTTPVSNSGTSIVVTVMSLPSPGTYRFTVGPRTAYVSVSGSLKTKPVLPIQVKCGAADGVCNVVPDVHLDSNLSMVLLFPSPINNVGKHGATVDGGSVLGPGGTGTLFLLQKRFTFRYKGDDGLLYITFNEACESCSFSLEAIEVW